MKKIASLVCAVALALSMPVLAFAAPSPSGEATQNSVSVGSGVTASIVFDGQATVVATDKQASNVELGANDKVMGSIEITSEDVSEDNPLTLTFSVGSQYAGYKGTVFIEHGDGTTDQQAVEVDANGNVNMTITKLSVFTLVIDTASAPAGTVASDGSAASPKTGVSSDLLVGGIAVLAVAAVGTGVALRKKITE
ncbi:MAG: hypothetical protein U0L71_03870 [Eggerthellaceae bacterium]|nr:hypothetical protein [Eggerthellaceae bacterium]